MLVGHPLRQFGIAGLLSGLIAVCPVPAASTDGDDPWPGLVQDIFSNRSMNDGSDVITIEMPSRAEDAAIVPVTLRTKLAPTDSRRVLEEMVPRFPAEIGGGPITDLTNGLMWAAAGIENADRPALKLVAASRDPEAAKSLVRLAENAVAFLRRSPDVQKAIPDLTQVLPEFKPTVVENRVSLAVDAHQAAALADALTRPARRAVR